MKTRIILLVAIMLVAVGMVSRAQNPTYQCILMNDAQGSVGNTYEFDVYLQGISGPFELAWIQLGININPAIKNGGIITVSRVDGTSELNVSQIPAPNKFSFNASKNCIIMTPMTPPGTGLGTTISGNFPGTRITRIRLSNSNPWGNGSPNLSWSFSITNGYATGVAAYVNSINTPITTPISHTTNLLSNPVLVNSVPLAYNVSGSGTICSTDYVVIGLDGSQTHSNYQLLRNGVPYGTLVSGTGGAMTWTVTGAGTYSVVASNVLGSTTMTGEAVISTFPDPVVNLLVPPPFCYGATTTLDVGAGYSSYLWSTGETTQSILADQSGVYSVSVTDANGCVGVASVSAIEAEPIVVSAVPGPILCFGGSAEMVVSASGGTLPYLGTGNFSVSSGNYSYTVTDALGCSGSANVSVVEPSELIASAVGVDPLCFGGTSAVTVSASGGTAPFSGIGVFATPAGSTSFTVTDANGCQDVAILTLGQPDQLVGGFGYPPILCNGLNTTVTYSATGGVPPYTVPAPTVLSAGSYSFTVNDANGCIAEGIANVIQPDPFPVSVVAGTIACFGGQTTISVSANGGTPPYVGDGSYTVNAGPYSYTVTDANGCVGTVSGEVTQPVQLVANASFNPILCYGQTTPVTIDAVGGTLPYSGTGVSNLGAGNYAYSVTDHFNCSSSVSFTLTQPQEFVPSITFNPIPCNGQSTLVTFTATGGTPPYQIPENGNFFAGNYSFTFTDANGCTSVSNVSLSQPDPFPVSVVAGTIACFGGQTTITVMANGGTPPYVGDGSYSVNAGPYGYTVTDSNGCVGTVSGEVTQPDQLVANASFNPILCYGQTTPVTIDAVGGTPPYTGAGVFNLGAGVYSINVTDNFGCISNVSFTLTQPTNLVASVSVPLQVNGYAISCYGLSDGSVTLSVSGGVPPYSYLWENGSTVANPANLFAGTYYPTVTDANGCVAEGSSNLPPLSFGFVTTSNNETVMIPETATIMVDGQPIQVGDQIGVFFDGNGVLTCGGSVIWDGNATALTIWGKDPGVDNGFAAGEAFVWKIKKASDGTLVDGIAGFGAGNNLYAQDGFAILNSLSGISVPSIANELVAILTQPEDIFVTSAIQDYNGYGISCYGVSDGQIVVDPVGGSNSFDFLWSNGATTQQISQIPTGNYVLTITDAVSGCEKVLSFVVTEPSPMVVGGESTAILCHGGSSTVTISATGAVAPYTGIGEYVVGAGSYSYTVTDSNGCSGVVGMLITEPSSLAVTAESTSILCNGGSSTVTVSATGGTAPYTGTGEFVVGAGSHSYTVTDANGCSAIANLTINEPTLLTASALTTPILCNGGTSTVTVSATGGTAPYTGIGEFVVSAGNHSYPVSDANGCSTSVDVVVTEPALLSISAVSTAILCNGGTSTVTVSATGGTAPYSGIGEFEVGSGSYSYTVTDSNGCSGTVEMVITEPSTLAVSAESTSILCNGGSSTVTVSATGGTAPFTGTGEFVVGAGSHSYTVTDANGCAAIANLTINEPTLLAASAVTTPILCNGGTSTVTVSATGGTAPYTGIGEFVVSAGNHSYPVSDANGCSTSIDVVVTEPALLSISAVSTAILCNGGTSTVTVSATGGTAPYTGIGEFVVGAGSYSYTVTDSNGCSGSVEMVITEPSALAVTAESTAILCNGGSSTVTVTAMGGTAPYTGTGEFVVTAGNHTFTVSDANGCTAITVVEITEPSTPVILGSVSGPYGVVAMSSGNTYTMTICSGAEVTTGDLTSPSIPSACGTLMAQVTYSTSISTLPPFQVFNQPVALPVPATTISPENHDGVNKDIVFVSTPYFDLDNSGTLTAGDVSGEAITFILTVTSQLEATATSSPILCQGGTSTVSLAIIGGTPPYSWTNDTVVGAGSYSFQVADALGCSITSDIVITEPAVLTAGGTATPILCYGGSSTVTVSATGGTAPYTGIGDFIVGSGNQAFVVTDANGCVANVNVAITEPTTLAASTEFTPILCNGGTSTVTVSVTGGTAPYSGIGVFVVGAGNQTFPVSDANGCTTSVDVLITEPSTLSASTVSTAILCNGGTSTVTVSATGGTAPYTGIGELVVGAGNHSFTVTDANGCSAVANLVMPEPTALVVTTESTAILCNGGLSTVTISASGGTAPYSGIGSFLLVAGTYSYSVTDSNGCISVTNFSLTENSALSAASVVTNPILCYGGQAVVSVSASGGSGSYTGVGTFNLVAGDYTFTVSDDNGCQTQTGLTVSQPELVVAHAISTPILCFGGVSTITITATGGFSPYTGTGSFTVTAGTHAYSVTDANNCLATISINVLEPANLSASTGLAPILCNGGSGIVTVSANGGTPPYSGTGSFSVVAGNYSFNVTDANGCSTSAPISVSEPTALSGTYSFTPILCNGDLTDVQIMASGGTPPYTGIGAFNVYSGVYTYSISDQNGCSTSLQVEIPQPAPLVANSIVSQMISCNGGNALVSVSAYGGTSPYLGTGTFSVAAGTHNFLVFDANGCSATTQITVTQPAVVSGSLASGASYNGYDISCPNSHDGKLVATGNGGIGPYSYSWSTGFTGGNTLTGLGGGAYSVTVTDSNGCSASASYSLIVPSPLVATLVPTHVTCYGGTNGAMDLSVAGGVTPYSYNWSNGQYGQDLSGLTADNYAVIVEDMNGCQVIAIQSVNQPALLQANAVFEPILCFGQTTTVTVSAVGGIPPYTGIGTFVQSAGSYSYTVSDANGCTTVKNIVISQPTQLVATVLQTGGPILCNGGTTVLTVSATGGTLPYLTGVDTYTVTAGFHSYVVMDSNGCETTASVSVSQPSNALTLNATATPILCNGGSSTVTVAVSGGTAPLLGNFGTFVLGAGTYTYTVTDALGCSAQTGLTINQPSSINVNATHTPILCYGGTSTVVVTATGGTAPYVSGTGTFSLGAGSYNLQVTDANGCLGSVAVVINQPAALVANVAHSAIQCYGGSSLVTVSATGGTAPYVSGIGTSSALAGTYTYTVTDANGCTDTESVTINQPAVLSATATSTPISCFGGSSTVTVAAVGGTGPYSGTGNYVVGAGMYNYSVLDANGCFALTSVTVSQPSQLLVTTNQTSILCNGGNSTVSITATGGITPYSGTGTFTLGAGTYSMNVTDANGCLVNKVITITQPVALAATATYTAIQCNGGNSVVTVAATGGTQPYAGVGNFNVLAGTHSYVITDANGCTQTVSVTITQPAVLVASAAASSINCFGGNASVTVTAVGGTSPFSGTGVYSVGAGNYNYSVVDAHGCVALTSLTVTQPAALVITPTFNPITCAGGSTVVNLSVSGGTPPYSGTGPFNASAGNYSFTVTDSHNCSQVSSVVVSQPQPLTVGLSNTPIQCAGGVTTVSAFPAGGTLPYTFHWSNGSSNSMISSVPAGVYFVTVSDANGCGPVVNNIVVTQPLPVLIQSVISDYSGYGVSCNGSTDGFIHLTVTGGSGSFTYLWSNNSTTQNLDNIGFGTYSVTISDSNGCSTILSRILNQPSPLAVSGLASNVSCFGGNDGNIDLTVNGGVSPYYFDWSNTAMIEDLVNLEAGNYSVTVYDSNGCYSDLSFTLTSPLPLSLTAAPIDTIGCGLTNGSINIQVGGGTAPYSYAWSNSTGNEDLSGVGPGNYSVTVTDSHFCQIVEDYEIISIGGAPDATFIAVDAGVNIQFFPVTQPSGITTVYQWNFGDGSPISNDPNPLHGYSSPGTFYVTLVVTNPCGSSTFTRPVTAKSVSFDEVNIYPVFVNLYPNPGTGLFHVDLESQAGMGELDIRMLNVAGQVVDLQHVVPSGTSLSLTFDLSHQAEGVYFLQVISSDGVQVKKVVLDR